MTQLDRVFFGDGEYVSASAAVQTVISLQAERDALSLALIHLAHEMRHMLSVNPQKDGGLYRQRLDEADALLRSCKS